MPKELTVELFQPVYQISWDDYRELLRSSDARKTQVHQAVLAGKISVV